jgi:hypothetical protein
MDILALAALVLSTAWSQLAVPDLHLGDLVEPTVQAAILTPLVLTGLLAFRLGGVAPVWERRLLALFLLAMPTVYLGALALHGGTRSWLTTELAVEGIPSMGSHACTFHGEWGSVFFP